jgi:hypothetical protein
MPTSPSSTCPFRPVMPDRAYFEQHGLGVSEVARRLGVLRIQCQPVVHLWPRSGRPTRGSASTGRGIGLQERA